MTDNEKLEKINLALFGKKDVSLDTTLEKIDYLKSTYESARKLSKTFVWTLVNAIDAKDEYTAGHSERVADITVMIGKKVCLPKEELQKLYYAALLHDVGKIGISDGIINKTSKLNDEEYEMIQNHPIKGAEILNNLYGMPEVSEVALYHHERYDGSGYPYHLKADQIPLEAQIVAVADAYDAMTSKRSYRDVLPQKVVREEIAKGMGTQFNPIYTKAMLEIIDEDKNYILHG